MKTFFGVLLLLTLAACGEVGTSYDEVTRLYSVSQRVSSLNKTIEALKEIEENEALSIETHNYLEYEFPIRADESYVINYRFRNNRCFKIGVDTYFNKQKYAQNVVDGIIKRLESDSLFGAPRKDENGYQWRGKKENINIELNIQQIERGTINLSISASENLKH